MPDLHLILALQMEFVLFDEHLEVFFTAFDVLYARYTSLDRAPRRTPYLFSMAVATNYHP
jgi:hypothetical protein